MAGPKVAIPALQVAELGAQVYARVDTSDRWRIDRVDSYLYSMVFNRPDSDYFRRDGLTAFLTTHLFERLTAGVEYRRDEYISLESPQAEVLDLVQPRRGPAGHAPVMTDGTMASMLVRLEFTTAPSRPTRWGVTLRDPERSDRPPRRRLLVVRLPHRQHPGDRRSGAGRRSVQVRAAGQRQRGGVAAAPPATRG